jgi:hypothetical protein
LTFLNFITKFAGLQCFVMSSRKMSSVYNFFVCHIVFVIVLCSVHLPSNPWWLELKVSYLVPSMIKTENHHDVHRASHLHVSERNLLQDQNLTSFPPRLPYPFGD